MPRMTKAVGWALGALGFVFATAVATSHQVQAVAAALVTVTNTATTPVPTKAVDAFNAFGTRVFPSAFAATQLTVPAGKYLVINSVSGFNNGNTATDLTISVQSNGNFTAQAIPWGPQNRGSYSYLENANVYLVADPGSTIYFIITDTNSADFAGFNVDVHGYYVNAS